MGRKIEPRVIEHKGFKAEILGASRNCQLWINDALYMKGIKSLRDARLMFLSYAKRHAESKPTI